MAMEEIRERYELAMERIRAMKQEKTVSAPILRIFSENGGFYIGNGRVPGECGEGRAGTAEPG